MVTGKQLIQKWRNVAVRKCPKVQLPAFLGLSIPGIEYLSTHTPRYIIGADEVGYGAIAGPVTVAAFAARPDWSREGLRDSKKLTDERIVMHANGLAFEHGTRSAICSIDNERIDRWGVIVARQVAFEECLEHLREQLGEEFNYSLVVLDGDVEVRHIDHIKLPKADDIVPQVSAASVIAKYTRDGYMSTIAHGKYPKYGFNNHVGYGTDDHRRAIAQYGMCPLHRKSYKVKPYKDPVAVIGNGSR